MSTTLAGHPLLALSLVVPRVGAWTADVEADTDEALSGVVTLDLEGRQWRGTVVRGGVGQDLRWRGRIVGAGGLLADLPAVAFASTTLQRVLAETLRAAGEAAAPTDADLSAAVNRWHRAATTGSLEVAEVALRAGMTWRALADGTVWVGRETWAPATLGADLDVMAVDPTVGRYELEGDAALDARPGTTVTLTIDGAAREVRVGAVHHRLDGIVLHTALLEEQTETTAGRLLAAFESLVRRITRRFDRQGVYGARVVAQTGDLLDIQPDDPRRPSCQRVPYRTLPGLTVQIPAGSRVSFTYEDGDPRRPIVVLWEPSTAAGQWSIYGGTRKVARDGEDVMPSDGLTAWITSVSLMLNTPGAVTGAPGSVTPPVAAIGMVDGGASTVRVP